MAVLVAAGSAASMLLRAQASLDVLPAQGSVFVLVGQAAIPTVQIGSEGPLVVDTQPAAMSEQVLAAVRGLSPRPIRHIVLTSGGEQQRRRRGEPVEGGTLRARDRLDRPARGSIRARRSSRT